MTYRKGTLSQNANTPRAPSGPERIEVAYGKVPLRAGWVRMLCKGRAPSVKVPDDCLQVFRETGC